MLANEFHPLFDGERVGDWPLVVGLDNLTRLPDVLVTFSDLLRERDALQEWESVGLVPGGDSVLVGLRHGYGKANSVSTTPPITARHGTENGYILRFSGPVVLMRARYLSVDVCLRSIVGQVDDRVFVRFQPHNKWVEPRITHEF